jgi:hypothetical protein
MPAHISLDPLLRKPMKKLFAHACGVLTLNPVFAAVQSPIDLPPLC